MDDDPPYEITITPFDGDTTVSTQPLRGAVVATLRRHDKTAAQINIALVGDKSMARLNRAYLNHDGPTDVLTYNLREPSDDTDVIDGEIVVSVDTAMREALRRGHSVDAELALYAAHGVLHLLGYNDDKEESAAKMHAMEDEILESIGIGAIYGNREK